jgi:2-C-methyl-D-erythritol 4-phosphate cytidylyltransferase
VTAPAGDVDALVLAAGQGTRLGRGPKALVMLGGRTLLERAVEVARAVAGRVVVGAPPAHVETARRLCGPGIVAIEGAATRRQTMLALLRECRAPLVLVLDVVHPFVTTELARRVVDVARRRGAAVAAVPSGTSVYWRDAEGRLARHAPGATWSSRKPFAFQRSAMERGLAGYPESVDEAGLLELLQAGGQGLELVPTDAWNIKLTTAGDLRLAEAIEAGASPVSPRAEQPAPRRAGAPRQPR